MTTRAHDILDAARTVLIDDGSAGFSMRRVAGEIGISLGNLQYHFPTRAHLLAAMLEGEVAAYRDVLTRLQEESMTRPGLDVLTGFLNEAIADAADGRELALFRALFSFREPEIEAALGDYYRGLATLMETGLGHLASLPPDDGRVQRASTLLLSFLDGFESTGHYLRIDIGQLAGSVARAVWAVLTDGTALPPEHVAQ